MGLTDWLRSLLGGDRADRGSGEESAAEPRTDDGAPPASRGETAAGDPPDGSRATDRDDGTERGGGGTDAAGRPADTAPAPPDESDDEAPGPDEPTEPDDSPDPGAEADAGGSGGHEERTEADGSTDGTLAVDGDPGAVLVERLEAAAAEFVAEHPNRELDRSPASLARLDDAVGATVGDRDLSGVALADRSDEASVVLTTTAFRAGGYLAAVFRRHEGARWDTDDGVELVVPGPEGAARLDPVAVAAERLRTGESFRELYETMTDRLAGEDDLGESGERNP